jgi:hypothetical protein
MTIFGKFLAASSVAATAVLLSLPASAQEPMNFVGTWKGMATAVHIGSNPYRMAEKNGPNLPSNVIEFTYTVTEQSGNRFAGQATNGKFTETIIGAVQTDNARGIILDDDGQYLFTVKDANTLETCYNHSFPTSRVVGCWAWKRVP